MNIPMSSCKLRISPVGFSTWASLESHSKTSVVLSDVVQCFTDEAAESQAEDQTLLSLLATKDLPYFKDRQLTHVSAGGVMSKIQEQLA